MHSASANGIVHTLLQQRLIADLLPYTGIRKEVKYGKVSPQVILTFLAAAVIDRPGDCLVTDKSDYWHRCTSVQNSKPLFLVHIVASHCGTWMLGTPRELKSVAPFEETKWPVQSVL